MERTDKNAGKTPPAPKMTAEADKERDHDGKRTPY